MTQTHPEAKSIERPLLAASTPPPPSHIRGDGGKRKTDDPARLPLNFAAAIRMTPQGGRDETARTPSDRAGAPFAHERTGRPIPNSTVSDLFKGQ